MSKTRCLLALLYSIGFLLLGPTNSYGQRPLGQVTPRDSSFDAFLPTLEQATNQFINGDPTRWKLLCSQADDVTILGGFGGYEKGWKEVGPRYDWASAQFKASGAKKRIEYISKLVRDDLAYTVTIERTEDLMTNQKRPTSPALRVTEIFRKEGGAWKLLHRHADPFLTKKAPVTNFTGKN